MIFMSSLPILDFAVGIKGNVMRVEAGVEAAVNL